jgi:hypothetical protein
MERPPESLKSFADRIARAAASEEAEDIVRMLRVSGLTDIASKPAVDPVVGITPDDESPTRTNIYISEPGVPPRQSKHIGIWERKTENGKTSFVRRLETMDEWHFWANVGRLEVKGSKIRVLFIGESVARGYLYDPVFTPAMALQMILEEQFGKDQIEVIDLARTNLSYQLRDLSLAALQLEPDIAVFFAGNNWDKKISLPTFADIAQMDEAIAKDGILGVKRICDEYINKTARLMVNQIASAYKNEGIPFVWLIPEFNLADWREPFTNAPFLRENRNREWISVMKEARQAFSEGDYARAEERAAKVVEIDQGTCAAGYYILADCRRLANDHDGQRKYLELARDAQVWDNSIMYIPKPYEISQRILREELPKYDCQIIDLPVLFKQYLNGEVAGNRLFLDYCHMTTEGIQLAMGSAASCVLRALKGIERPWVSLVDDHIAPAPEIEAEASFMAAIHDAHRYQTYDMVHHFCARAIKASPHIAEIMLNYIDLQVQNKAPIRMSDAEEQIARVGSALVQRYLFRSNDKRLDRLLLAAIVEALEEAGIPARERLARLYREEHSTRFAETDLLHHYYYQSSGQPHELEALVWPLARVDYDPRYYRAYWPDSRFVFIGEAGLPLTLSLTCRLPRLSLDEGTITIDCNGKPQVEIGIDKEWSSWTITVPGDAIRDGINEIDLHWPVPNEFHSKEALSEVIETLCKQKYPEFYPIFGEVHSFKASSVGHVAEMPEELEEVAVSQAAG